MRTLLVLALAVLLASCTGVRVLPAAPGPAYLGATVPGFSKKIRIWGDEVPPNADKELAVIRAQIGERVAAEGSLPNDGRFDVLVLSGGGSDGAFGAGLLNGWSDAGGRPEFGVVTGISTGALLAPYAFLGPAYDGELERLFTNTKTEDIAILRPFRALLGNSLGLTDVTPLKQTVERALSPDVIRGIASEHRKGRRLWIGTTNLDAQRPVIWDIGEIAAAGGPNARALIRDILIASSAIPGALPPVQIEVEIDGARYSEMHVDGGVTRQLFAYPHDFRMSEAEEDYLSGMRRGTIWVLRNTKLDPDYAATGAGIVPIAARSISTLIKAAGVADVQIVEAQALRDGWGLRRVSVPADFSVPEEEFFDPVYMRALYERGYGMATDGTPWELVVPTPE